MIYLSTSFKCPLLHVAHRGVFVPYLVADAVLWCKKCDNRQSWRHFTHAAPEKALGVTSPGSLHHRCGGTCPQTLITGSCQNVLWSARTSRSSRFTSSLYLKSLLLRSHTRLTKDLELDHRVQTQIISDKRRIALLGWTGSL